MAYIDRQLLKESRRGHVVRMERLVANGADVNCTGKYGYSPLTEAASLGHVDAVRFLLRAGADATHQTSDNAPTHFFACVRGHAEVVELLLGAGASPNANRDSGCSDPDGDTPGVSVLHIAIRNRNAQIVEALLRAGANTEFISSGQNAMAAATATDDALIVGLVQRSLARW